MIRFAPPPRIRRVSSRSRQETTAERNSSGVVGSKNHSTRPPTRMKVCGERSASGVAAQGQLVCEVVMGAVNVARPENQKGYGALNV